MIHRLKINESFASAILTGEKSFEVRKNTDRGFQKGDIIEFTVINGFGDKISNHILNSTSYKVTYVLNEVGLLKGYVAFGIKKI